MKPAANGVHERERRTSIGPASLLLLLLAALAPVLAEASVPRIGASLLEHEDVAASQLDSSRQAPPFRSPAVELPAPATAGSHFTLFAGDELTCAARAPSASAFAPDHAGDLALAPLALASRVREESFSPHLGADVFGLESLQGTPELSENLCRGDDECLAGTRVRGFELLPLFRIGASPSLSLWSRQACGSISCGLVSDSPEDPWGLFSDKEMDDRFFADLANLPRGVAYAKDRARRELSAAQVAMESRPKSVLGYLLDDLWESSSDALQTYSDAPARARQAVRDAWTTRATHGVDPDVAAAGGDYGQRIADAGYGAVGDVWGKGAEVGVKAAQYAAEGKAAEVGLSVIAGVAASRTGVTGGALAPRVKRGVGGRVESAFARIEPHHLGGGTGTTTAARRAARSLGNVSDDAGHLIANRLGGPGSAGYVVPQNPRVNRGAFRDFEAHIAEDVLAGREVYVRVVPRYQANATRPFEILYQVRVDGQTTSRTFPNPP